MKKILLLTILVFSFFGGFASTLDGKTVTFDELIKAMQSEPAEAMECCPDKIQDVNFRNITIEFNRQTDGWLDARYGKKGNEKIFIHNINKTVIKR